MTLSEKADGAALARGRARIRLYSNAKLIVEDAVWWPDLGYESPTKRVRLVVEGGRAEIVTVFEQDFIGSPSDHVLSAEAS